MKIEIVEFYPEQPKKKELRGTMHVYIVDFDMDIRGITVIKKKGHLFFRLPHRWAIDKDTKEKVWFPLISFTSKEKSKELITLIKEEGTKYIKENFK